MNGIKYYSLRLSLLLVVILAITPACKDNFESSIPYVSFTTPIVLANSNGLTIVGNPMVFAGGYGGIVVLNTGYSYVAYDVTCPYEVSTQCKITIEASNVIATCPCCGTQYNLMDGSMMLGTGPGTEPLRPYGVTQSGGYLYVSN